jgi:hypothetical protein
MTLADMGEISVLLIGAWGFGIAFGVKIQSVVHFFRSSI